MDTQQPSPSSPRDSTTTDDKFKAIVEEKTKYLKANGVDVENLAILFFSGNQDLLIGEIPPYFFNDEKGDVLTKHPKTLLGGRDVVPMKNPRGITRMRFADPRTGQHNCTLVFSEFDFVGKGVIETKPQGAYYLDWLDFESQSRYLDALASRVKGEIIMRENADAVAGGRIVAPSPHERAAIVGDLGRNGRPRS